ncbi:MAG: AbrB/MazE/SpoVT family DNA-binding domain-containing protein [Chloroflexota bacterium]|nr:AbrB/MazE/SpoVT family DNA-binding domain-containing protein [Chloroflexota bacterium]
MFSRGAFTATAGGAVSITLPRAWVDRYGLKPRDKVEVIVKDQLVIRPVPKGDTPALLRSLISRNFQRELRITVPVWWMRYHGLEPGDKVEVVANGELTVRPLPREGQREVR